MSESSPLLTCYRGVKWIFARIQTFGAVANLVFSVLWGIALFSAYQSFSAYQCSVRLPLWCLVSAGIALGIVALSLFGVACVFVGRVTGWEEKHIATLNRFRDGGIELEDTEDPKLINPYMDDTAEEMLTENQKPLEQLYHKSIAFTAKANFYMSVGSIVIMALGHVIYYVQLDKSTCDSQVYNTVLPYLYLWDICVVIFLYLRYRG